MEACASSGKREGNIGICLRNEKRSEWKDVGINRSTILNQILE
jgi:hypothetical protein